MSRRRPPSPSPLACALCWLALLAFCCALAALPPSLAQAHQTARSTHQLVIDPQEGAVRHELRLARRDLGHYLQLPREGPLDEASRQAMESYLRDNLVVRGNAGPCRPVSTELTLVEAPMLRFVLQGRCPQPMGPELVVQNTVMTNAAGGYSHFARIEIAAPPPRDEAAGQTAAGGGAEEIGFVFNSATPQLEVELGEVEGGGARRSAGRASAVAMGLEGLRHVVLGPDHLLFLLALLVAMGGSLRALLGVTASFTVAHSVALVLGALEVVVVPAAVVEPLIAASIAAVAGLDLLRARRPPGAGAGEAAGGAGAGEARGEGAEESKKGRGWWALAVMAGGFGLIHGMGFAYGLQEQIALVRGEELAWSILWFNLGVECGQLAVVLPLAGAMALARGRGLGQWLGARVVVDVALVVVGLGWAVARVVAVA